jgi:hypothetical protein
MKKLLFLFAIASMTFLSSCNKCKDDPCKNGASCDKKTGDCTCTTYYTGSDCSGEIRASYVGKYDGTMTTTFAGQGSSDDGVVEVELDGTDAKALKLVLPTEPGEKAMEIDLTLTSATAFEANAKFVEDDGTTIEFDDVTGEFKNGKMTMEGDIKISAQGFSFVGQIEIEGEKK